MAEYKLKDWKEVIDSDFPYLKITEETRQTMVEYSRTHSVGNTRLAMGRFYTDLRYETWKERVLSTPLP